MVLFYYISLFYMLHVINQLHVIFKSEKWNKFYQSGKFDKLYFSVILVVVFWEASCR